MRFVFGIALLVCLFSSNVLLAQSKFVRAIDNKGGIKVGILVRETPTHLELTNISDGSELKLLKSELKKTEIGISDDTAIAIAGVAPVVALRVAELASNPSLTGKIARVSQNVIYLTLGEKSGINVKQKLNVYRSSGEIRDPDTNKLLGAERSKIGTIEVHEVNAEFSKAKSVGDVEISFSAGDEVEEVRPKMQVAVFPLCSSDGENDEGGDGIAEEIVTQLSRKSVPVLERSLIGEVLVEQVLQNTVLFEPAEVQRLGRLVGASAVVTGKIVSGDRENTAYIRLIDVQTGKILFAARTPVKGSKRVSANAKNPSPDSKRPERPPAKSEARGKGKKFKSKDIELADSAPAGWIFKEAKVGVPVWSDRDYAISKIPKRAIGGTLLWRSKGEKEWLPGGTITALRPCIVFAFVQTNFLNQTVMDEVALMKLERDGWEESDVFQTTFPNGEGWKWKAFSKKVDAGEVFLPLNTLSWGPNNIAVFVFKGTSEPAGPPEKPDAE